MVVWGHIRNDIAVKKQLTNICPITKLASEYFSIQLVHISSDLCILYGQPLLRMPQTFYHSAIKSEDSEVLDGGTSQLSSQREYDEIKMWWWGGF